jgi:hypothetical protein
LKQVFYLAASTTSHLTLFSDPLYLVLPPTLQGHLRWDSLGEYLALAVSLEHLGETQKNQRALTLGSTLNKAIERLLENRKSPGRKVGCLCVQLQYATVLCDVLYCICARR